MHHYFPEPEVNPAHDFEATKSFLFLLKLHQILLTISADGIATQYRKITVDSGCYHTYYLQVNFPNLDFSKTEIEFGCILNDTEVAQFVDITNSSPMPVTYRWSFVVKEGEENIK